MTASQTLEKECALRQWRVNALLEERKLCLNVKLFPVRRNPAIQAAAAMETTAEVVETRST